MRPLVPAPAVTPPLAALDSLRQAAGRLLGLQQQHAQALPAVRDAEAAGPSSSTSGPAAESVERLEHSLQQAMAQRQDCHTERTRKEEDLERIEHKLAKVRQRLDNLLALQETAASPTPTPQTRAPHRPPAEGQVDAAPASVQTKEAKARLAELDRQIGSLRKQFTRVLRPRLEDAKAAAEKQHKAANALLTTEGILPVLVEETRTDRLKLREILNLPEDSSPAAADAGLSFDQYLAQFTEPDDAGNLRLRPHLLEGEYCGAVVSALHKAAVGDASLITPPPLWEILMPTNRPAVDMQRLLTNSPAQNDELLKPEVSSALGSVTTNLLHVLARGAPNAPRSANRRQRAGQADARAAFLPAGKLLTLLATHREELLAGLLRRATQALSVIAGNHRTQVEVAQALERQVKARNKDLGANIAQLKTVNDQRKTEQARLQELQEADRAAARAAASTPVPANTAAITQTTTAPAGPDREAQILKLRGDLAELDRRHMAATSELDAAVAADQSAAQQERKAQAAYETAVAAWGRAQDSARREWKEAQAMRATQSEKLALLKDQVSQAREALLGHPVLAGLLLPADVRRERRGALELAIERHVAPDNTRLHQRARHETGYAGAYHSLAHLVEAVCDIHEDAMRCCPGLFAARSQAEFDAAAAALRRVDGKGSKDRVCTHPRAEPIARGYSNDLDQTRNAVPVNESCYSLCWHPGNDEGSGNGGGPQGGRVVISHLYPLVPHRQLQTLEP